MARTDEERFKVQYMRLKREAEQRRLERQERIKLSKQLRVSTVIRRSQPIISKPIKIPLQPRRRPIKKRRFFLWGDYFKNGIRTFKQRRKI